MKAVITNMIGAGRLNIATYERVEADPHNTTSALIVVIMSSLAAAIGGRITGGWETVDVVVATTLSWLTWVGLTYILGTRFLPGPQTEATFGQVLRTTGFSAAPGILRVFGFLPVIGWPIFAGATLWMLVTFVVAVRQALDLKSTLRAISICLLGWVIYAAVLFGFVLKAN